MKILPITTDKQYKTTTRSLQSIISQPT